MSPISDSRLNVWITGALVSGTVVTERQKRCALERLYQSAAQQSILPPLAPARTSRQQSLRLWRLFWRRLTLFMLDEKSYAHAREIHHYRYYAYSKLTDSLAWIPAGLAV